MLFVHELLTQYPFLVVEVEEHAEVFGELVVLLCFNDALDFSLFCDFLSNFIYCGELHFGRFVQKTFLLFTVDLSFDMLLLPLLFAK